MHLETRPVVGVTIFSDFHPLDVLRRRLPVLAGAVALGCVELHCAEVILGE